MTQVRWLKTSFVAGAVADAVFGIVILLPSRMGETEFTYPMGLAASLMFGWTLLLLWGYQKPAERKGVLLITIFPVLTGLLATAAYHLAVGTLPLARMPPALIIEVAIMGLMGFSYFSAQTLDHPESAT